MQLASRRIVSWVILAVLVHLVGRPAESVSRLAHRISKSKFAEHVRIGGRLTLYASAVTCGCTLAWQVAGRGSVIFMTLALAVLLTGLAGSLWVPALNTVASSLAFILVAVEGLHLLVQSPWTYTGTGTAAMVLFPVALAIGTTALIIERLETRDPGVEFATLR